MRRTDHAPTSRLAASCVALLALVYGACGAQATARPTATSTLLPIATATPVVLRGHITEQPVDAFPDVITTSPTDGSVWFANFRGVWQINSAGVSLKQCCAPGLVNQGEVTRVAVGSGGTVWFATFGFTTVRTAHIFILGASKPGDGFPIDPGSAVRLGPILADHDSQLGDTLWFVEEPLGALAKIGRIDVTGKMLGEYQVRIPGSYIYDLTAGPDGALWFTMSGYPTSSIVRMTADGHFLTFPIPTANSNPIGICTGPDGALWFTENFGNKIGRITTDGHITEYPLPAPDDSPVFITSGPDDALWFTEYDIGGKGRIGRITLQGTITSFAIPTAKSGASGITATTEGLWFTERIAGKIGHLT